MKKHISLFSRRIDKENAYFYKYNMNRWAYKNKEQNK